MKRRTPMKHYGIRLEDSQRTKIEREVAADKSGSTNMSDVIRDAVDFYFKWRNKVPKT